MDNNVLAITGMHRSGTSLITQWLHKCGLHVGNETLGPGIGNKDGHFEDVDFFNRHREILAALQLPDDGLTPLPLPALSDKQLAELQTLIHNKQVQQQQWGWKEPRTCLFLPVYRQLLPEARYLIIWRDYRTVVSSLISRIYHSNVNDYINKEGRLKFIWNQVKWKRHKEHLYEEHSGYFLKVWATYNEIIIKHMQQLSPDAYLLVDHSSLLLKSRQIFEHVSGKWGFKLQYYNFKKVYKERRLSRVVDIDRYVQDKSLLIHASQLQSQLSNNIPLLFHQPSTNSHAL